MDDMLIFSGNANQELAQRVASCLKLPLGNVDVGRFSDGETKVEIQQDVRGRDVFIIQSTSTPTNDHLMELIAMADAMRRAFAARITAVVPYFGYARKVRRSRSARVPIVAKIIAGMMASVGISRLVTVDLHAEQIQGFFHMPVDNLYSTSVMLEDIYQKRYQNTMIVSPDIGGVIRARALVKLIPGAGMAIIDKRYLQPDNEEVTHIIGDVKNRDCLIVDDIVDTSDTLCKAVDILKEQGASKVVAYVTHPVLSGHAIRHIESSRIDEIIVTDTILLSEAAKKCDRIRVITVSHLIAEAIRQNSESDLLKTLFVEQKNIGSVV